MRKQVEALKDHADFLAQAAQIVQARIDGFAVDRYTAAIMRLESVDAA